MNANQVIDRLIWAEMSECNHDLPMQRVLRDERMALQVAVSARPVDQARIARAMREAVSVARMWGVEL